MATSEPNKIYTTKTKWCPGCERNRRARSFFKNKASRIGLSTYCKDCKRKNKSKTSPEKIREYARRYREKAGEEKMKEIHRRYNVSQKGRERGRAYARSEKGKQAQGRYKKSEKGRANGRVYIGKRRAKKKAKKLLRIGNFKGLGTKESPEPKMGYYAELVAMEEIRRRAEKVRKGR